MYVVDILDTKNGRGVGPNWFTGMDLSLSDALARAQKWIDDNGGHDYYKVMYHIVGCL